MILTVTKADKVSSFVTRLYKGLQKPLNYRTSPTPRKNRAEEKHGDKYLIQIESNVPPRVCKETNSRTSGKTDLYGQKVINLYILSTQHGRPLGFGTSRRG